MSTHKHIEKICCVVLAITLAITILFMNGENLGLRLQTKTMGYEDRLFDTSTVHTIDIVMNDGDGFLETCTNEEYATCSVVIDGEAYKNVAIRAKGNTSLSSVASYGNDRYSFKIEFDHYDSTNTYHGLDKLVLNNIIQDNTYMKDYLTYQLMGEFGVSSPLCSYVNITVNGETWGLYLAVEGVEDSFLERNYGNDFGELYKPDSMSMGGGRGNGQEFNMNDWEDFGSKGDNTTNDVESDTENDSFIEETSNSESESFQNKSFTPGMGGMGSNDVSLIYSDDNYESYSNIFDSAKTDVTDADKDRLIASLKNINENTNIESSTNVEDVIRYFVVHNFVLNFDSYTGSMIHNYYLYEEDGQLSMIPWDYNLAFGGFMGASDATSLVNYPIDSPVSGGTIESRPMLAWIFENEEYTELYHTYFQEFITMYFDSGYVADIIDSVKEMIAPYVEEDPSKFCTYEEFVTGIDMLKEFCLLRAESVQGQLDGTIASTSDGQKNQATLVDAGNLNVSDMGSMGNVGGGGNFGGGNFGGGNFDGGRGNMGNTNFNFNGNDFNTGEMPEDMTMPENNEMSEGMTMPENSEMPEGMTIPENNEMPEGMTFGGKQASSTSTILPLIVISIVVLIVGLIIIKAYKKKK